MLVIDFGCDVVVSRLKQGFTLAELLIALVILGVIATFTIPKILNANQQKQHNTIAKETVATISQALKILESKGQLNSSTTFGDLTPFMNYVAVDTESLINNREAGSGTSLDCSSATYGCLKLHSGAILQYPILKCFGGTAATNVISAQLDPDGRFNEVKSLRIFIGFSGKLETDATIPSATYSSVNCNGALNDNSPGATYDPPWFKW